MIKDGKSEPLDNSEQLFASLFKQYNRRIYNYIYKSIGSEEDANDILQEVFIILHAKLDELHFEEDKIVYWLYRVARNLILSHLKKNKKKGAREYYYPGDWEFAAERENLVQKIELREMEERLNEFLNTLSEKERTIFLLHRVEKLKYREIKEIMGLSERTLKRVVRKILEKIDALKLFE